MANIEKQSTIVTLQSTSSSDGLDSVDNEEHPTFPRYRKVPGTVDHGKEYEQIMCAFYALKLIADDNVENFEMTTNNKEYGLFDDISLKITFKNKKTTIFLIQLKHKEAAKPIRKYHLYTGKQKGDFDVEHYFESMMSSIEILENVVCILITNSSAQIEDSTPLSEDITVEKYNYLEYEYLLSNGKNVNVSSTFRVSTAKKKLTFYLFTEQNNLHNTKIKVEEMLQSVVRCNIYGAFVYFMAQCWSTNFVLSKDDIIAKLVELVLSPYMKTLNDSKQNAATMLIRQAILEFAVTIIVEDSAENVIENIWQKKTLTDAICDQIRKKFVLEIDEHDKMSWYLNKVPIVVKMDNSNETTIRNVVKLMKKSVKMKHIVLVWQGRDQFEDVDIFASLSNLITMSRNKELCDKILNTFKVSLQGRQPISLKHLNTVNQDLAKCVGVAELLQMSQGPYVFGNLKETLPDLHIPRSVSTIFIKTETIFSVYKSLGHRITMIIDGCERLTHEFLRNKSVDAIELLDYLTDDGIENKDIALLLARERCTYYEFSQVCVKSAKSNVCLFRMLDEEFCVLSLRKGEETFREFQDLSKSVTEEDILHKFDSSLNLVCAPPGMGKSTLMQVLYNNCPTDCWGIYVDLINCNSFLAKTPNCKEIWDYILRTDVLTEKNNTKHIKTCLYKSRKVCLYLDGLDELDSSYVNLILEFIKNEASNGFNIWISSRENLQDSISETLNVVPIQINGFDRDQQEGYIRKKLKGTYRDEEIDKILRAVFANTNLVNSQELLGIPLQLYIITEMFLTDREAYKNLEHKNTFVLTHMYKTFFDGKLKATICKVVDNRQQHQLGSLKVILRQYEIPALMQCFNSNDFKKINVDLEETQEFIDQIKKEGDKYGIIKKINHYGDFIFVHQTYAEYFACVWLRKNKSATTLLFEVMFSYKYKNLQRMFDIMLAENNPLHLSIIYKNLDQFRKHIDEANSKDQGGRTPFHLLCTYGLMYPRDLDVRYTLNIREASWYVRMVNELLQTDVNISIKDELFHLDCIMSSVEASCLYPIEKILEKQPTLFGDYKTVLLSYYSKECLIFYSARMGLPNLFEALISEFPQFLHRRFEGEYLLVIAIKGTRDDDIVPPRDGNIAVVKVLIERGFNINKKIQIEKARKETVHRTVLDLTCEFGRYDMVNVLTKNGAKCSEGNTAWHRLAKLGNCKREDVPYLRKAFDVDINTKNDEGMTALHVACRTPPATIWDIFRPNYADNGDIVNLLTNSGADVDARDPIGTTPLLFACCNNYLEITKILLENGASINAVDDDKNSTLHYAALSKLQFRDLIKLLLKYIDVNTPDKIGATPFHFACTSGKIAVNLLLENKALATVTDIYGNTALDYALQLGQDNPELIELLIDQGLDVNSVTRSGSTPLHIGCRYGKIESVKILLKNHASINAVDLDNKTALFYAVDGLNENKIEPSRSTDKIATKAAKTRRNIVSVIILLLENGVSINALDKNNKNALYYATRLYTDNRYIIKLLIRNGVDVNSVFDNGTTMLHLACQKRDEKLTQMLVERGACTNAVDQENNNALHDLHRSWSFSCCKIITLLTENGIDVNARNQKGETVLGMAVAMGDVDAIRLLFDKGAVVNVSHPKEKELLQSALMRFCQHYAGASMQFLIDAGADVNAGDNNGTRPLQLACANGWPKNVKVLLKNNASVNALDRENNTALHYAANVRGKTLKRESVLDITKLLISRGIDVNVANKNGVTAFHLACKIGIDVVLILLDHVRCIKASDKNNSNALHYAFETLDRELIKLLIFKNVDVNASNSNGVTPLHLACSRWNIKMIKFLIDNDALVNALDADKNSPLHYALRSTRDRDVIKLLIDKGIDANGRNDEGTTALHLACRNEDYAITQMFLENLDSVNDQDKSKNNALHYALTPAYYILMPQRDVQTQALIDKGIDVNAQNENGTTPFHLACRSGHDATVQCMFSKQVQFELTDRDGNNALHYASQSIMPNVSIITCLINLGLKVNTQNKDGTTALHFACKAGRFSNVEFLIINKAEVDVVDELKNNALHYAAMSVSEDAYEVIELLMIRGVDINSENSLGSTALHLACQAQNKKSVIELLNNDANINLLDNSGKTPREYASSDGVRNLFQAP